jgi:hypothetical protein
MEGSARQWITACCAGCRLVAKRADVHAAGESPVGLQDIVAGQKRARERDSRCDTGGRRAGWLTDVSLSPHARHVKLERPPCGHRAVASATVLYAELPLLRVTCARLGTFGGADDQLLCASWFAPAGLLPLLPTVIMCRSSRVDRPSRGWATTRPTAKSLRRVHRT